MRIKILKTFIILLIMGMIIPIYLYNDNVSKDQAVTQKDYRFCEVINYKFLYYRCVNEVQHQKKQSCENFPVGEVKDNCIESTVQQKNTVLQLAELKSKYSALNYSPIALSVLIVILFLFLIKGPWIKSFPRYEKFLQQVTEVLPESDYFARQSFLVMSAVILMMGIGVVLIFEALAFFYK